MPLTDPLGDMLTRIRNGQQARKDSVLSPASKLRARVLDVLAARRLYPRLSARKSSATMPGLRIELKYFEGQPAIQHVARVSKPGRRVYSGAQELPRVRNGLGITIVSTPKGVLSDAEARDAECRRRSARGGVLMSRIGKRPVPLPAGVTGDDRRPHARRSRAPRAPSRCRCATRSATTFRGRRISVQPANDTKQARAFWGMQRTLVQNLVTGVTEGFTKMLEITGVGYRADAQGKNLKLQLGYSHDVDIDVPEGHRGQDARQHHGRDFGHRQAEGRPGRRRDPPLAQARALQGQGHQVSRRVYLPQGREEEVSHGEIQSLRPSARQRVRTALRRNAGGRAAPVGPPLGPAHLRPGHRRRGGPHRGRRLDAGEGRRAPRPARPSLPRQEVGKRIAERAKAAGVTQRRVRSRRLPVPWPRQGAGRCRPRRRTGVLIMADETNQTEAPAEAPRGGSGRRSRRSRRPRPPRARRPRRRAAAAAAAIAAAAIAAGATIAAAAAAATTTAARS